MAVTHDRDNLPDPGERLEAVEIHEDLNEATLCFDSGNEVIVHLQCVADPDAYKVEKADLKGGFAVGLKSPAEVAASTEE